MHLQRILARIESKSLVPFGRSTARCLPVTFYSTQKRTIKKNFDVDKRNSEKGLAKNLANLLENSMADEDDDKETGKATLAKNLASLVQESYSISEQKPIPRTRLETKRFLETRIKKKVKEQFSYGKFHNLMTKVIADPDTLKDAYDCLRVTSNIDLASHGDPLPFESMAEDLICGNFDVFANTFAIFSRGPKEKEKLVLPNLKLRIVQEAIRIVLEVVYRPHFSKISHGFRSGRSHLSALKYIRKEIPDPDWWFTVLVNKKLDECILGKLVSLMEEKIDDSNLCGIIRNMFDAGVLNVEFGSFMKGHGLPQEGALSPILMNIYLDLFDREVYRMSMQYEISEPRHAVEDGLQSKLRGWFRRQINRNDKVGQQRDLGKVPSMRVHCCRFMDEIFFAVSGPKEAALAFKSDIESLLKNSLYLEIDTDHTHVLASNDAHGVRFLGMCIRRCPRDTEVVRSVHKLKDKVKIFAEQKQESWDEGRFRIGRKWLAHGLKKVKESEIKQLADTGSILHQISGYRKPGMKTDHWYKQLLKIWMNDVNAKHAGSEEFVLAKHVIEPALPKELTDSYYEFQRRVEEYVASETSSTLALLSGDASSSSDPVYVTEILAPVNNIMKRLNRYGLTNIEGYARRSYVLILLDDCHIIDWFAGLVRRWLRWYMDCDNFNQVKQIISNQVRMSCIRTLASKYRIHETVIAIKFDEELSRIPSTEEIELEDAYVDVISKENELDGATMYGVNYSGVCLLSLARTTSEARPCSVIGCTSSVSGVYAVHVMERQKFPAWKTGFSSSIHGSLHRRRIGLCRQHLTDLFLGDISLQSMDFCAKRY